MIFKIENFSQLLERIGEAKKLSLQFVTNCYPDPVKTDYWIAAGLWAEQTEFGLLVWRRDRSCWHLSYAASAEAIPQLLATTQFESGADPIVSDIITKDPAEPIVARLTGAGFQKHTTLVRMLSTKPVFREHEPFEMIRKAGKEDLPALVEIMAAVFDPLAEQIPTQAELVKALEAGRIMVAATPTEVVSFLYHEPLFSGSHLRFWATHPQWQGRGAGTALLDAYLASVSARRYILWVIASNGAAMASYQKRGYAPDGLLDIVLVRKYD